MLEIGTNSYINKEFADEYIASRYPSADENRKRWEFLENDDKEVFLRQAMNALEALPWQGRKADYSQALAFPRLPFQYGKIEEIAPLLIKQAQAELAFALSDTAKQAEGEKRAELQAQGVESFSIGDLSESYGKGGTGAAASLPAKAKKLVAPYLNGGYVTC